MDRYVRNTIRNLNTIDSKRNYMVNKQHQHKNIIDSETRNVFPQGMTVEALKCASGFNMHGMRNFAIHKNVTDST